DQFSAGLHMLASDEDSQLQEINTAYRAKFSFPLIICVRHKSKDEVLEIAAARLHNSPTQERATALVEVTKIANQRLEDLVEVPSATSSETASV
ncbi:MAG: OHCU decarboxylase, partial [Actinophytocola sp.]|nr:OHCU decarboxylase [Actinophytocola sp.]